MLKRLIAILLVLMMVCSMVACRNKEDEHTDDPTTNNQTISDENIVAEDELVDVSNLKLKDETVLWEKDFCLLRGDAVSFDANWDKYIHIGGEKIYSEHPTDISVVPNYLFDENASIADLNAVYYTPHVAYSIDTTKCFFDTYASGTLTFTGTSYEDKFAIERVDFITDINAFEGGIDTLVNMANYNNGICGIGSTYAKMKSIIGGGEEISSFQQDNLKTTHIFYGGENVTLFVTIQWFEENGIDSGVITDINWEAVTVRDNILRKQDGLERFNGFDEAYPNG